MTMERPNGKLNVWHGAWIGSVLTVITIVSSWLLIGKGWIEDDARARQQVAINTARLDVMESSLKAKSDRDVTRAEHEELLQRVYRLEQNEMIPCTTSQRRER